MPIAIRDDRDLALRMTTRIHEALPQSRKQGPRLNLPTHWWEECERLQRMLGIARGRGWRLCLPELVSRLESNLRSVRDHALDLLRQLEQVRDPPCAVTLRDVHEEVEALFEEFESVHCDLRAGTLSVTTEPIELEGVDLGRFVIRLDLDRLRRNDVQPYDVIALDQRGSLSGGYTHPHVAAETLCEGDGKSAIRRALAEGRLVDFFNIVGSVLQTYNAGSAYASLDEGDGITCGDCGGTWNSDEIGSCDCCGESVCDECYSRCTQCEACCCAECSPVCKGCDQTYCRRHLRRCAGCQELNCEECLSDNLCLECRDDDDNPIETEEASGERNGEAARAPATASSAETLAAPDSDAAVQPVRVGETVLAAGLRSD